MTAGGYTCHAHPPSLGGKECGHYNAKPATDRNTGQQYCEACGRTRKASDDRKRRAEQTRVALDRWRAGMPR